MSFAIRQRQGRARSPLFLTLCCLPALSLTCIPLFYVLSRSAEIGWEGSVEEIFRRRTFDLLVNTLVLGCCVTAGAATVGTSVAWCVEKTELPARSLWRVIVSLPLAVPAFISSYAWSSFDASLQTMGGAIFILTLSTYPLVYLPVAAAFRGMDSTYEDVSRSLGKGPWETFFRASLPQVRPALGVGSLLVLTHMFAEFGALAFLRVQTFTTAIFDSFELEFDSRSAALQSLVLILLCLPAAYGEMRLRTGGRTVRSGKGVRRPDAFVRLGWRTVPVQLALAVLLVFALAVPMAILCYWLSVGLSAGNGLSDIDDAVYGSLSLAIPGAVIVVVLALPVVLLSSRHTGGVSRMADRLPYVIHGLPGLVVALALVFVSIHYASALYQTYAVLMAAYAILYLPLAQSALRSSIALVPSSLEELARGLGRGPLSAFMSITLPNILPGIGAGLALVALELMRELTSTLMLAPIGVTTLATEVWSHTNDTEYAAAAPFAAMLVVVSAVPTYVFTRRGTKGADIE
ncbi:iron ABC transporter permease [Neorhizobium sp. NCHU2750]|uniref:ABC transporter permease n=1 Tax=Neorhizobium sp. NCHU2750 TaxID=1825976 RepID=UPI000EB617A7|nr:iron ABC transporter permease [Neorhizobium sp. NCHU2750]